MEIYWHLIVAYGGLFTLAGICIAVAFGWGDNDQ